MDHELNESELGTKKYWDNIYEMERKNFEGHGDIGEIWFGHNVQNRIVAYLCIKIDTTERAGVSILDVGCGNGALTIALSRKGFAESTGVDYAKDAIILAKKVAAAERVETDFCEIDILNIDESKFNRKFDIIIDKGTYDAISLSQNSLEMRKYYKISLCSLFDRKSIKKLFLIASCNWTSDELKTFFTPGVADGRASTRTFSKNLWKMDSEDLYRLRIFLYHQRVVFHYISCKAFGDSMYPLIKNDQVILALPVIPNNVNRGDVVICRDPSKPNEYLVKRITAISGDIVRDKKISNGYVWLQGANKELSMDSREKGEISASLVTHRAAAIIWPVYEIKWIK